MNKVMLVGRLTKDVEMKFTKSGTVVGNFTLAIDRQFKSADGEKETDFIPVVVWKQTAELCGKYIGKGSQIAISGRMAVRNYENKEGNKVYITEVIADEVQFLDSKKDKTTTESPKQEQVDFNNYPDKDELPF